MPLDADVTLIDVPTWLDLLTIVVAALGGALMLLALAVAISLRPLDRKGPPPSAAPHTP